MMEEQIPSFMQEDHESLARLLHDLRTALNQRDIPNAFQLLDLFWARLAVHIRAENTCLFPAILNAPSERFGSANGMPTIEKAQEALAALREDHNVFMNELSQAVKTMRDVLRDMEDPRVSRQLESVCETVSHLSLRLREHNALEEDAIYRWPYALLTTSELNRLSDAVRLEIENIPARFAEAE